MPKLLMELMRHESIETTLKYFVGTNAEKTAAAIWDSYRMNGLGANLGALQEIEAGELAETQ